MIGFEYASSSPSPASSAVVVAVEFWRHSPGWGWSTAVALLFILLWHYSRRCSLVSPFCRLNGPSGISPLSQPSNPQNRVSEIVSDDDLKFLIDNLEENPDELERWELVTERRSDTVFYTAKSCKPKNAPLKYLSITVFEDCSPEFLRDFYMDNDYRKLWDKTVTVFEQLEVDRSNGTEMGQIIKKFPLLTAREYVLAWRLWKGSDSSFYCFTKECEHPLAPRQRKFVRVKYFRSGWRIRKVPGKNASEIRMFHQEDASLNMDMAKLAFSKGIWSYICKMDIAFRRYSSVSHSRQDSAVGALSLIQKVPPGLDNLNRNNRSQTSATPSFRQGHQSTEEIKQSEKLLRRLSKKTLVTGVILIGGVLCLTRGNPALGAKVATAYIMTKLGKRGASSGQTLQHR
ncbi:hypothetical protein SAY87_005971 [Trapa incisa]|uniref:START domain-containing protein n=1 Tax=Trapa incisa TaxID=236973 RepID=A0AAN7KAS5_9MYRT|nr:hypothetical protein SAY87_005971 [Trapa incisa]